MTDRLFNPDEKQALNRARYGRVCDLCGDRTTGGLGRKRAPLRCRSCKDRERRRYARMLCLAAIELWADLYGEPPRVQDWLRRDSEFAWPSPGMLRRHFPTWNAAITAAGFTPRNLHQRRYGGRRYPAETKARAIDLVRNGATCQRAALLTGTSKATVTRWAEQAKVPRVRHRLSPGAGSPYIPPALRWETWERDNFTCRFCGIRRYLTIDHIKPVAAGGETVRGNLQTLCNSCNASKGSNWTGAVL